jgi:mono/diheme cytochrome c family protein
MAQFSVLTAGGWLALTASVGLSVAVSAATPAERLWTGQVRGLLDVHCVKCHGPIEQKGGLELDTPEAVLAGGDEGRVVLPGHPERSRLYLYLAAGADPHMPPKKQLADADREVIRTWIQALGESAGTSPAESTGTPNGQPAVLREFPSIPAAVDTLVQEGWEQRGVKPAPAVSEAVWCRRVTLDLAGRIPTPAEVQEFLAWPEATRREAWVDRWLASAEYPVRMRECWDVFLMGRPKRDAHEDRRKQHGWWAFLERAFRENRPWNAVVRDLLVARPTTPESAGASWFLYERRNEHQAMAEAVAPVVYGTRIDCAQCHDHPLAREIKQGHYWGLVAAFNRSKNVDGGSTVGESAIGGFINFTNLKKESQPALVSLLNGRVVAEDRPAPDQKETDADDKYVDPKASVKVPKFSRREAFAEAATRDNPLLARAFVNRMWATFLGRGLVHPADEMNARNAPSHPELLEWLARDFAGHGYDVRRLVRGLVLSRVYGLGTGDAAPEAFAGAVERPLAAEQLARSWRVASGWAADDDGLRRATVGALPDVLPRDYNATFQQAQFLANSPGLADAIRPQPGGTVARLAGLADDEARVREAFLAAYGRLPDGDEAARAVAFLGERRDRPADGVRDLWWALLTSAEFLTMP